MPHFFKFIGILLIILLTIFIYGNISNPYSAVTIINSPFSTVVAKDGSIYLQKNHTITYYPIPQQLALYIDQLQEFSRIVTNRFFNQEASFKGGEEDIIAKIHKERFDVSKPYVISAGHFAELYVRNFGIFYSSVLDGRFSLSSKDWEDRQRTALQTIATDLELLRLSGKDYTCFVPVTPRGFVGVNIYARASDSLFAIIWTLSALTRDNFLQSVFPANILSKPLMTKSAGEKLIKENVNVLQKAINNYLKDIIDSKTGLIKKNLPLSSARDQIIRQSSFYDNVIAWSTAKNAVELGLNVSLPFNYCETEKSTKHFADFCEFEGWKQKIISAFWDEKTGIFLDDLSQDSIKNHIFSGDAFIVTSTKILDFDKQEDRSKIEMEIKYVKDHKLDNPFPLRYSINDQPSKLYFFDRYFATSYMGKTIWSHWGMEYIKTLILLSKYDKEYFLSAGEFLNEYKNNIKKYGGYPELYDSFGNIYQTLVYRSLLHTGWVINYEQTKMIFDANHF